MMHLRKKTVLALAMLGVCSAVQADIPSVSSCQSYKPIIELNGEIAGSGMIVGKENIEGVGTVGIGVIGQLDARLMPMLREGLVGTGVYDWSGRKLSSDSLSKTIPAAVRDTSELGSWTYAQVGNLDVWFGEWHADTKRWYGVSKDEKTRTVFYAGQNGDVATTLPITTPVTFSVRSLAHYKEGWFSNWVADPEKTNTTLTANFASKVAIASGDINFSRGSIETVGDEVKLSAMKVDVRSTGGKDGQLTGNFFGTGAAGVAGIVKFSDDRYSDVAFGGVQNFVISK